MKSLFTKAALKSNLRHVYVGIAFVYTAAQTYLAKGNTLGFNKETYLGVGAQVLIALSALFLKYVDKTDPTVGPVAKAVVEEVVNKVEPITEPKPAVETPVAPAVAPSVESAPVVNP